MTAASPMYLALEDIAPVRAVRGNTDHDEWGRQLPWTEVVGVGGIELYVLHDLDDLDIDDSTFPSQLRSPPFRTEI